MTKNMNKRFLNANLCQIYFKMMAPYGKGFDEFQHITDRLSHLYIAFLTKYRQAHCNLDKISTSKATNKDHCDHLKLLL